MENPFLFVLAVAGILATPGPTNTLQATSGAYSGLRRSLPLIPAEAAGYLIAVLTIGWLHGRLVAESPMTAIYGRIAVGLYLAFIAVRLWRHGENSTKPISVVTPTQVFVTTLLNPKAFIFALAIIPFGAPRLWAYLLGFVLLVVFSAVGWIFVGASFEKLGSKHGWVGAVPRIGAIVIGAFSLRLLATPLIT